MLRGYMPVPNPSVGKSSRLHEYAASAQAALRERIYIETIQRQQEPCWHWPTVTVGFVTISKACIPMFERGSIVLELGWSPTCRVVSQRLHNAGRIGSRPRLLAQAQVNTQRGLAHEGHDRCQLRPIPGHLRRVTPMRKRTS